MWIVAQHKRVTLVPFIRRQIDVELTHVDGKNGDVHEDATALQSTARESVARKSIAATVEETPATPDRGRQVAARAAAAATGDFVMFDDQAVGMEHDRLDSVSHNLGTG